MLEFGPLVCGEAPASPFWRSLAVWRRRRYKPGNSEPPFSLQGQIMAIERTFSIIKPDATARNLTGAVNAVIEKAGLRISALTADRKSTRLNSSHPSISYAVFCLKKKKNIHRIHTLADTYYYTM